MTGYFPLDFLCVACLTFGVDMAWARYTIAAAEKNALKAALWSAGIFVLGGLTVESYVSNHWLLAAAATGGFFGTLVGVKSGKGD